MLPLNYETRVGIRFEEARGKTRATLDPIMRRRGVTEVTENVTLSSSYLILHHIQRLRLTEALTLFVYSAI